MRLALAAVLALAAPALAQAEGWAAPGGAAAETVAAEALAVHEALLLPGIIAVMAREGAQYGDALAETLFPAGPAPAGWTDQVASLYEPTRMEARVLESLEESLSGEDTAAMLAFLGSEPGRSLVALELAAREALLDEDAERAANELAAVAMARNEPRLDLLRRYAEANDLIETNVVGAMNANASYMMGLLDGGAMDAEMTEGDVLADVRAQEAEIRAETTEWVYSFLLLAYGPASDADIEALIAFSETEAGQALNRAVFRAFDGVFDDISYALGVASARYMTTEEA